MEQVLIKLVMALMDIVPHIIKVVNESKNLSEPEKKTLLMDINIRLTEATMKVQSVRFKDFSTPPDSNAP